MGPFTLWRRREVDVISFSDPNSSPLDLRFRIIGVPVRVSVFFWIGAVFLGWDYFRMFGFGALLVWVGCVFFSILLHEMGHVMMGRVFGTRGHIILQTMGGLAVGSSALYERWKRILVILAGPGIQLAFYGLLSLVLYYRPVRPNPVMLLVGPQAFNDYLWLATIMLLSVNLWWPILNLFPVWPLDGGQVAREIFTKVSPRNGVRYSLVLSIVVAGGLALNALSARMGGPTVPYVPAGGRLMIMFFAMFAIESFFLLQAENARNRHWRNPDDDDRLPWETDPDAWKNR